jgi:hypothetical protein
MSEERYEYELIADWLGDMPEAYNVEQGDSGEYTTILTIDVESLAERISGRRWLR